MQSTATPDLSADTDRARSSLDAMMIDGLVNVLGKSQTPDELVEDMPLNDLMEFVDIHDAVQAMPEALRNLFLDNYRKQVADYFREQDGEL